MNVVLQDCANAVAQRHGAEVELVLVLELAPVDDGRARAGHGGVRRDGAGGEQRGRRHRLHARPGREMAGQRVARVGGRVRGDGQDLPRARPDDDQVGGLVCPATAASAAFCTAGHERRLHRLAGHRCHRRDLPPLVGGVLVGAHDGDREAGRAGELLLEGPLQPGEPELVAVGVPRRRRPPWSPRSPRRSPCRRGPAARARSGTTAPAAGWRSGTPHRAGRRPARGSSRSRAAAG